MMKKEYGFIWNGKKSSNFNIVLESKELPFIPERRIVKKEIPGIDGEIVYDTGCMKRTEIKAKCYFKGNTLERMQQYKWQIKKWLNTGVGKLTFEDEADKFYLAVLKNKIDITELMTFGRFTFVWECEPYAYSFHSSENQLNYNDPFAFGAGYGFDLEPSTWNITENTQKTIVNWGMYPVKPIIKIEGSCSNINIACNDITINYGELSSDVLEIDCNNQTAKLNNSNALKDLSIFPDELNFISLVAGENLLSISGTDLNCQVTVIFRGKY